MNLSTSLLQGTFGAILRDGLHRMHYEQKLSYHQIEERLNQISIDEQYWGDLLALSKHNQYNRSVDRAEAILERYVIRRIVQKISCPIN